MAASPDLIRETLCQQLQLNCAELETVFPYETEQLGKLPCLTLLLRSVDPNEVATGPRLDVTWRFEARIYTGLSDWEASQRQIDAIVPQLLLCWINNPTLDGLIEWWKVSDGGQPIEFATREQWMRKTLLVEVVVEDVGT